jgi:hypothetical protein
MIDTDNSNAETVRKRYSVSLPYYLMVTAAHYMGKGR